MCRACPRSHSKLSRACALAACPVALSPHPPPPRSLPLGPGQDPGAPAPSRAPGRDACWKRRKFHGEEGAEAAAARPSPGRLRQGARRAGTRVPPRCARGLRGYARGPFGSSPLRVPGAPHPTYPPSHVLSGGALASALPGASAVPRPPPPALRACPGLPRGRRVPGITPDPSAGADRPTPTRVGFRNPVPTARSVPHLVYPAASAAPAKSKCPRPATPRPPARPPGPRGGRARPGRGFARDTGPGLAGAPPGPSYPGRQRALRPGSWSARRTGRPGSPRPLRAAGRCGSSRALARAAAVTARAAPRPPIDMLLTSACTRAGRPHQGDPRRRRAAPSRAIHAAGAAPARPLHPGRPGG